MVKVIDPVDRVCNYARELYIRDIAIRKLANIANKMMDIAPEETKWVRIIIEALIDDIATEAAMDIRCKEEVKLVLDEIQAQNQGCE